MWGSEKTLKMLHAHYESTGVMPPALQNRPALYEENDIYSEAFNLLSAGRQNTDHIINPIKFSEVMEYCDCVGEYCGEERLLYWRMVSAADHAFIESAIKQRASKLPAVSNKK